jgi:hypothetical protein
MEIHYPGSPKMLRETLCEAQALLTMWMPNNYDVHIARLQALINDLDKHRPLGPDGKHGNLHTRTCGCEDKGHGTWCMFYAEEGPTIIVRGLCQYCGVFVTEQNAVYLNAEEMTTPPSEE